MITLAEFARLAEAYAEDLAREVSPIRIGDTVHVTDREPVVMATVNLSRDSTYRESVAVSPESAVRKARVAAAQGAHCVDVGAESTTAAAERVDVAAQIDRLMPVVKTLAADGIVVSVESYHPEVVGAALDAGARIVNLTGTSDEQAVFEETARHDATLILCHATGANVREIGDVDLADPIEDMATLLSARVERARAVGVEQIAVDPGLGFYYANTVDPATRVDYQTRVLTSTFRLRSLGLPICHAMPHAFDLFEEEFRTAEGFFTVLARLGGTGIFRTHEVGRVVPVLRAMSALSVGG
ncbi:MAG TPA: dihydropteroate synthase [Marmoricola sp.]